MKRGYLVIFALGLFITSAVFAEDPKEDISKAKLFAPNIILENQAELELNKQQFTAIKKVVVDVQWNVADHEWDVREAYLGLMQALDETPISEERVLELVGVALLAENGVKKGTDDNVCKT